jgi:hypothetical protein
MPYPRFKHQEGERDREAAGEETQAAARTKTSGGDGTCGGRRVAVRMNARVTSCADWRRAQADWREWCYRDRVTVRESALGQSTVNEWLV